MRPVIGISPSVKDGFIRMRQNYAEAVIDAGGIPVFLPYSEDSARLAEYASMLDGLIFAGGADLDPKYYGEKTAFDSVEVTPERDVFELALFPVFFETGKPILGICRGIQLMNVAMGGSLYQHIEGHRQEGKGAPHTASVKAGTRLSGIFGTSGEININSYHHQAVKRAADGLTVSALSPEGICEALEFNGERFFVGVQWHPEMIYKNDKNAANLFSEFVSEAKKFRG